MEVLTAYEKVQVVTPSTAEPLTLSEIKTWLRIPVGQTYHDELLRTIRGAVTLKTEEETGRAIMRQTRRVIFDSWSTDDSLVIPYPPLVSLTTSPDDSGSSGAAVCYKAASDRSWSAMASSDYALDTVSSPGRVVLDYNASWPSAILHNHNPIRAHYTCGYSTSSTGVPRNLRNSMLMTIAHMFENPEALVVGYGGVQAVEVPMGARALLEPFRVYE